MILAQHIFSALNVAKWCCYQCSRCLKKKKNNKNFFHKYYLTVFTSLPMIAVTFDSLAACRIFFFLTSQSIKSALWIYIFFYSSWNSMMTTFLLLGFLFFVSSHFINFQICLAAEFNNFLFRFAWKCIDLRFLTQVKLSLY